MELELGLKFARVADDFTSADFQLSKDRSGPLFLSTETDTMFILTAHLRGYRKQNIKIEINEDGTRIAISGERAVQESVMMGWRLHKKETEIRGFRKGFKIPDGVILDKISAKFDEDESVLTISMPKKEKGICGVSIEEVKEEEHELARVNSETLEMDDHDHDGGKSLEVPEIVSQEEEEETLETKKESIHDSEEEESSLQKVEETKGTPYEETQGLEEPSVESTAKARVDESIDGVEREEMTKDKDGDKENDVKADEKEEEEEEFSRLEDGKDEGGRFKICTPIVAGSALLLSIVVIVIQFFRSKSQSGKRKD